MNAAALTLLRLESLLHFVFPPSKFPQYWAFFGDLRLANARRYRGSLADFDYSARTASLSIANREKIHAAIQCQAQRIGFCALRGRAQRTNRCKRARCEVWIWWNVGSKPAFFCHIFNFYCPYRGKLYPIIIVLGVNLCYTISVSLCLKIGRAGFRACFPRVDTAVLADRERQHLPRSRRLLHAPPACPRILGRAAIPCRMQPEFCGTMRRSYFIIVGGGLCFVCKNWAAACGAAVHCLD